METTSACSSDAYDALAEEVSHHDSDAAFSHVYFVMLFMAFLWIVGKSFQRIGMPALVGEIVTGIIMGPHLLNLVGSEGSEFLIIIGEVGLIMLVVEAGIDVDIGMLKLIGPRGLGIAILGSIIPLSIGFLLSIIFGTSIQAAIAIGSCFAPTSMGIALNVLKKAKILNTPTGQLIIAAAILDDVIALIILSELSAMKHPTAKNILLPLIVSPVLILVFGYLSITQIPKLIKQIMAKIPKQYHEYSILLLLFCSTFALIPGCHLVGSSHLLGAFLSGLMFCTDHTIHHVWNHQIKRILAWMLRVFFACTIGFAIPVQEFTSVSVITKGLIYMICAIGKIVTGLFGRPLDKKEFLTIGFSMSAWGEFAFIIATASYGEGTIDKEYFSAVLLSVLLSVIISPYCLKATLTYYEKQKLNKLNKLHDANDNEHPVYYAINTRARGQWGHQDKILHRIFQLKLEIIDFRSWHAPEYNYSHHRPLTKESFYVQDQGLFLPPTKHLKMKNKQKLKDRIKDIKTTLKETLGAKAIVSIKRWLPGVRKAEDKMDKKDMLFGEHVPKVLRRPSYCRREAFKQAHSIMSSIDWDYQREKPSSLSSDKQTPSSLKFGGKNYTFGQAISKQLDLGGPTPMKQAQSVPSGPAHKIKSHNHFTNRVQLMRQFSEPKDIHTGAGHGGQAKGVGALPFTSKMINIHDHWAKDVSASKENSVASDDSTSYIYGDEDAQHHTLPEYKVKTNNQYGIQYALKPMAVSAVSEDTHTTSNPHKDIEIITTQLDDDDYDMDKSQSDNSIVGGLPNIDEEDEDEDDDFGNDFDVNTHDDDQHHSHDKSSDPMQSTSSSAHRHHDISMVPSQTNSLNNLHRPTTSLDIKLNNVKHGDKLTVNSVSPAPPRSPGFAD